MDRKDKFRKKKAIDNKKELRYWRKRAQEMVDGVDSSLILPKFYLPGVLCDKGAS